MNARRKQPAAQPPVQLPARAVILSTPPPLPAISRAPGPRARVVSPVDPVRPPSGGTSIAFSTGEVVPVRGIGIVGRDPKHEEGYEHIVTIPDPDRLLSRTHFAFGTAADGQVWISDLGSANGTYLDDQPLTPGVRRPVHVGSVIRFGDHTARILIG